VKIIVTGATGFIGKPLVESLAADGHEVIALTRSERKGRETLGESVTVAEWDGATAAGWGHLMDGADAIINLAGENIAAVRWTKGKKDRIKQSRLHAINGLAEAVRQAQNKPQLVIQASAVGYYGSRGEEELTENSPPGSGFLPEFNVEWEKSAKVFRDLGLRVTWLRTGLVLGRGGGLLSQLTVPFKFFVGGPIGDGRAWAPWIHLDDEIAAIRFLLAREDLDGAFNLTASQPERMKDLCRTLGKVMKRPSWLPFPAFAARALMGELADELLLVSVRVLPKRLEEAGFEFKYTDLEAALIDLMGKK